MLLAAAAARTGATVPPLPETQPDSKLQQQTQPAAVRGKKRAWVASEDMADAQSEVSAVLANEPDPESTSQAPEAARADDWHPLASLFDALDNAVSLMHSRQLRCTFSSVQQPVEAASHRSFTWRHLGQIAFVFPEAYSISHIAVTRGGVHQYELVLAYKHWADPGAAPSRTKKSGSHLPRRREEFRSRLAGALRRHCTCAQGGESTPPNKGKEDCLGKPADLGVGGTAKLSLCNCIPAAELLPPQLLSQQRQRHPLAGKDQGPAARDHSEDMGGGVELPPGEEKGDGLDALRRRLRRRQLEAERRDALLAADREGHQRRQSNLPGLADALRSHFRLKGCSSAPLHKVAEDLASTSRHPTTAAAVRERLRLLAGAVPEWCSIQEGTCRSSRGPEAAKRSAVVLQVAMQMNYKDVRQMISFMVDGGGV